MKKLLALSIAGMLLLTSSVFGATTFSTNIVTTGIYLLVTNAANVYNIELTSDKAATVHFYDQSTMSAPYYGTNYVTTNYPYRLTYSTNYVTSYVGQSGYTNWYTNAGLWTLTITNSAATNVLDKAASFVVGANTYANYSTDLMFNRGVVVAASTNVSVIFTYRTP